MLRGEIVGLRAQQDSDIEIFETELLNDVETRMRSDSRPWRPVAPGSPDSPYRARPADRSATVIRSPPSSWPPGNWSAMRCCGASTCTTATRTSGSRCGRRSAGEHLGTDIVRVLCRYGFAIRGLHRLQITTLADNHAMIAAAIRAGFVLEGTSRDVAWVNGSFADGVTLSQLAGEWSRPAS